VRKDRGRLGEGGVGVDGARRLLVLLEPEEAAKAAEHAHKRYQNDVHHVEGRPGASQVTVVVVAWSNSSLQSTPTLRFLCSIRTALCSIELQLWAVAKESRN
jgi:hypothetical protein